MSRWVDESMRGWVDESAISHPLLLSFILHPSSFILHPSSLILHPFYHSLIAEKQRGVCGQRIQSDSQRLLAQTAAQLRQ
jgi:hypothetical protein